MKSWKSKCPIPGIHFLKARIFGEVVLQWCNGDISIPKGCGIGFWGWIRAGEIGPDPKIGPASGVGAFIKALFIGGDVLWRNTNA